MQPFDDTCRPTSVAPTLTAGPTLAEAVSILQSDNKNTSSPNGAEIQASYDCRNFTNISGKYATYREKSNSLLKPFKSL